MEPDKVEIVNLTIAEEDDEYDDSAFNFIGWF
jgi:hypothetical protein